MAEVAMYSERIKGRESADADRRTAADGAARRLRVVHALVAAIVLAGTPATALASLGGVPHARSVCVRERTVLRPEVQSADRMEATLQEGTRLVPVRVCAQERRVCYAGDEELSMSRCDVEG
jgi:hypothetical protein